MRLPRPVWGAMAVACLLAAVAAGWGAFTRFADEAPPPQGTPRFEDYQRGQYADARASTALGVAAAFLLLGAAACAQRAWERRGP